jgi:glycosyltransferase involved in cell wall biosynthesis
MITVIPYQINVFLAEHVRASMSVGDVLLVSGGDASELDPHLRRGVAFRKVGIVRPIRPLADLVALVQIIQIIRTERPDIVQTLAPKAGLLGMTAAFICRVPVRVHWFTGQVWAVSRGLKRIALKSVDWLIAMLATDPLVDSPSQRNFLVSEGVAPRTKLSVLGSGSVRGIDERRFRPDVATRASTRQSLGIPEDRTVLVFVGRLTRDKGLIELSRAIRELRQELPELHTILVGFEEGNFTQELLAEIGNASDRVSLVGYSDNPERFLTASDFMVQPSYREGFGASVIEAAACGLPTIGTRIVGLIDAIVDGETGLLIPPRETKALKDAIRFLARNPDIRMQMGSVAQHRARKEFATKMLTEALQEHYVHALAHASRA